MTLLTDKERQEVIVAVECAYEVACAKERHHIFREAFCKMRYTDTKTNKVEVLWNSRNGVTPFIIRSCNGNEAEHSDWERDQADPLHRPRVGERIFVDFMPEDSVKATENLVKEWWSHAEHPMSERFVSKQEAVEQLALGHYTSGVPPMVVEVTEDLVRERGWNAS